MVGNQNTIYGNVKVMIDVDRLKNDDYYKVTDLVEENKLIQALESDNPVLPEEKINSLFKTMNQLVHPISFHSGQNGYNPLHNRVITAFLKDIDE